MPLMVIGEMRILLVGEIRTTCILVLLLFEDVKIVGVRVQIKKGWFAKRRFLFFFLPFAGRIRDPLVHERTKDSLVKKVIRKST